MSALCFAWRPWRGVALLLLSWGFLKIPWENALQRREEALRYHGLTLTRPVRDQLGQGATLALLGGFRAVVANFLWIDMYGDWERREWFKIKNRIDLVTTLQPRSTLFWEMGGWQLAWNASADKWRNPEEPSRARRLRDERFWIEEGRKVLERGTENVPEKYQLWFQLAWVYDQKIHDYLKAAHYYQEALQRPKAPLYLERFVGYALEKGGDRPGAYAYWKRLWFSTTDRSNRQRAWDKVEAKIRQLEKDLAVPRAERVFSDEPLNPAPKP